MSLVDIIKILYFTSIIIWCLPPIRQFRGRFFDFFLVLACIDPIGTFYGLITKSNIPLWVYSLFIYLLIPSALTETTLKKFRYVFITVPIIFVLTIPYQTKLSYQIFIILENAILLLIFLQVLIVNYASVKKINIFYLVLVFYITTNILKIFNLLVGFADAAALYMVTSIIQIAFGLYFSIARED